MPVGAAEFKNALGQFASGVTAVTTRDAAGRPYGLTVSAFCSVSLDPPLVLVSIDNRSEALEPLRASGVFGVSLLAEHQAEVSRAFAASGDAKFDSGEMETGRSGVLLVGGAVAHLECRLHASHVEGDHTLCVGLVERARCAGGRPLVYHAGDYRGLSDGAASASAAGAARADRV